MPTVGGFGMDDLQLQRFLLDHVGQSFSADVHTGRVDGKSRSSSETASIWSLPLALLERIGSGPGFLT